jgi:hypothetical protein
MERIKEALEKARQERQIRQGSDTVTPQGTPRQDAVETGAIQTQTISVDDALLRENRIVTGLEHGPFTDANNLLRTQVLQRFKENNWNVLAVTSPGEGEGVKARPSRPSTWPSALPARLITRYCWSMRTCVIRGCWNTWVWRTARDSVTISLTIHRSPSCS